METITFQTNVKAIDFPIIEEILKRFKAKDIRIIKDKKDETEMTEEEFLAKIDRSMKSKRTKVTVEKLRAIYLKKS